MNAPRNASRSNPAGSAGLSALLAAVFAALGSAPAASGQLIKDEVVEELQGVGLDADAVGNRLPMDATFRNAAGERVELGDFFDGERPVLLVPAYYDCPMLCTLVLDRVLDGVNKMEWTAGVEYRIVSFSFDATNGPAIADQKQSSYLARYNRRPADMTDQSARDNAWSFLVTDAPTAKAVCQELGYYYRFLPDTGEYAHTAAIYFVRPDGTVHNFIEGLSSRAGGAGYEPEHLRSALSEAADNRVGTVFDRVFLSCFRYDPKTGEYVIHPMNVMRILASAGALILFVTLGSLFWASRVRAKKRAAAEAGPAISAA